METLRENKFILIKVVYYYRAIGSQQALDYILKLFNSLEAKTVVIDNSYMYFQKLAKRMKISEFIFYVHILDLYFLKLKIIKKYLKLYQSIFFRLID